MKTEERISVKVISLLALLFLQGCALQKEMKPDPYYAPPRPSAMMPPQHNTGSIYQENSNILLFEDNHASRVGDIITVMLSESTNASKKATTDVSKSAKHDLANPTILGATPSFNVPGLIPLSSNQNNSLETSVSGDSKFAGDGSSAQSNSLKGDITVSVVEVLPNGNLVIRGEKWINLNQGDEFVRISGIIRPEDVSATNTILSTRVANARISYSGSGTVANANTAGWLSKFFISAVWPF